MSTLHATSMKFIRDFFRGEYEDSVGKYFPYMVFGTLLMLAAPWIAMAGYGLVYGIFQRPGEMKAMALSPFLTFFFYLTDSATPGFDQRLMRMFHPSLLSEKDDGGSVQRGLLRAMSRCLVHEFGPITNIPRDTVVMRKDGNEVNCMALVDFAKVKQVRCQLSWKRRAGVVKKYKEATGRYPERKGKEATTINGISMAFPHTFYVTSFHVDPKKGDEFNILKYVHLTDFDDFGALFVDRLFQHPPVEAVAMMTETLRVKYAEEKVEELQRGVQSAVDACGGVPSGTVTDLDIDQTSCVAVHTKTADGKDDEKALDGVDMEYQVKGKTRNMQVYVRLTFSGLQAMVARYEVRLLGDERVQVILDHDKGTTAVVA